MPGTATPEFLIESSNLIVKTIDVAQGQVHGGAVLFEAVATTFEHRNFALHWRAGAPLVELLDVVSQELGDHLRIDSIGLGSAAVTARRVPDTLGIEHVDVQSRSPGSLGQELVVSPRRLHSQAAISRQALEQPLNLATLIGDGQMRFARAAGNVEHVSRDIDPDENVLHMRASNLKIEVLGRRSLIVYLLQDRRSPGLWRRSVPHRRWVGRAGKSDLVRLADRHCRPFAPALNSTPFPAARTYKALPRPR